MFERESERFNCVVMRGGTSRGIYILESELPQDQKLRNKIILSIFGSPDPRQIDGLGGADPLTSKLAIIGPSLKEGVDVDYTFGQVDIKTDFIDYGSNCGNISSGVGPFAIEQGLVKVTEPVTRVKIYNTNTGKILTAEVPVVNGKPKIGGDFNVDGVPGTGAKIMIDFSATAGSKTGKLLPTGNAKDILDIPEVGKMTVSLVDAASPMVFILASDIGLTGTESPDRINGDAALLKKLENIRAFSAEKMGMVKDWKDALTGMRAVPLIAFVGPPQNYKSFSTGEEIRKESVDFVSRCMFMQVIHKTYSATATVCTGTAASIPGTIVNDVLVKNRKDNVIRFGHPCGVIEPEIEVESRDGAINLKRAAIGRTARRIMEGYVYVPKRVFE